MTQGVSGQGGVSRAGNADGKSRWGGTHYIYELRNYRERGSGKSKAEPKIEPAVHDAGVLGSCCSSPPWRGACALSRVPASISRPDSEAKRNFSMAYPSGHRDGFWRQASSMRRRGRARPIGTARLTMGPPKSRARHAGKSLCAANEWAGWDGGMVLGRNLPLHSALTACL